MEDAFKIAGVYPIAHYIKVRQDTILKYIINRPIHGLCSHHQPPKRSGTVSTQSSTLATEADSLPPASRLYRWWTQPLLHEP